MSVPTKFYLFKHKNGYWYILYEQDGRRRWKSTRTRLKREAHQALREFRALFRAKLTYRSLQTYRDEYIAYSKTVHTPKTTECHFFAFSEFEKVIGNFPIASVGVREIEQFLAEKKRSASDWTARKYFISLSSSFERARKWGYIPFNPFREVKKPTPAETQPLYFTKPEFNELLRTVVDNGHRMFYLTATLTGLRLSELTALQWGDIDFCRGVVQVRNSPLLRTKNGRNRTVPISDFLLKHLNEWKRSASNELVFHRNGRRLTKDEVSKTFKAYVRRAGVNERLHFHSLRHTFASWLVQDGVSLYEVQRLLGHSSIAVTQVYSHLQPEQLHETVNRLKVEMN